MTLLWTLDTAAPTVRRVRIDHVILASADVEATSARLRADFGLQVTSGGEHADWGTINAIVPAGTAYLEVLGVTDDTVATANPIGQWLAANTVDGDRLAGLALEPDDFDRTCSRLGLTPMPGSRTSPDGTAITWQMAGVEAALGRMWPFFIKWDRSQGADVQSEGEGLKCLGVAEVELGGDARAITEWVGGPVEGLTLVGGPPGLRSVRLSTEREDLVLT